MVIKYRFGIRGETFECGSMEDLVKLHNYQYIVYIDCSRNNLTVLPTLPNSLTYLDCSNNCGNLNYVCKNRVLIKLFLKV